MSKFEYEIGYSEFGIYSGGEFLYGTCDHWEDLQNCQNPNDVRKMVLNILKEWKQDYENDGYTYTLTKEEENTIVEEMTKEICEYHFIYEKTRLQDFALKGEQFGILIEDKWYWDDLSIINDVFLTQQDIELTANGIVDICNECDGISPYEQVQLYKLAKTKLAEKYGIYIDTLVGYGINIKYESEFVRVATFDDMQDAYQFYNLLIRANEVKEKVREIEIEAIWCIGGEYEYKTIQRNY